MGIRKIEFAVGEYYHIYNRGVDKRIIFEDEDDVCRFFQSMDEFNIVDSIGGIYKNSFVKNKKNYIKKFINKPNSQEHLVDIVAYCLNSNHYHFILKEIVEGGISEFMQRLGGYTKYFNHQHKRSGVLFQGKFKAKHLSTDEYLLYASCYVNLNNHVHQLRSKASQLMKSSWGEYVGENAQNFCKKEVILGQFKNCIDYKKFAKSSLKTILLNKQKQKELENLLID